MPPKPRKGPILKGDAGLPTLAKQLSSLAALAEVWDDLTPQQRSDLLAHSPDLDVLRRVVQLLNRM